MDMPPLTHNTHIHSPTTPTLYICCKPMQGRSQQGLYKLIRGCPFPARRRARIKKHLYCSYFWNATYAYTIYLPQTYTWLVSTRLVLTRLPVPSPSTTEDENASTLQLFSEWYLSLQSPTVLPFRFPLHVVVLPCPSCGTHRILFDDSPQPLSL